jgi:hypothetical protein
MHPSKEKPQKIIVAILLALLVVPMMYAHAVASAIPQAGWSLLYVDSEELVGADGAAVNALDGDVTTFWHTEWSTSDPPPPHEIQIDLGANYGIDGFRYLPRQDGGVSGRIGQYAFYISNDDSQWGEPVAAGTFANNASEKEVTFIPKTGQFVRLVALSEVNGNPWTSIAEINIQGKSIPTYGPFDLIEPAGITNPVLTALDVTDVQASFVADPFIFYENNTWYMFFEVYIPGVNRGDIGLATSWNGLHWMYEGIVLSEGFHHSYPLVFKYNDSYYMVPESYQIQEVRIYEAYNFPYDWNYIATIVSGRGFVDPSIFRYNNKWWMFVSDTRNSDC